MSLLLFRFVLIFLEEKLKENPALSRIFNKVLSENEDKDSATMFKLPNILYVCDNTFHKTVNSLSCHLNV